jgi:hypothetical protein
VAEIITVTDLPSALQSNELVDLWVNGANAKASRVAPCLVDEVTPPSSDVLAEARLVLVGAVVRWAEAGSGSLTQQTAGPFSVSQDTRTRSGLNFWPSEIEQLQALCADADDRVGGAFEINTMPSTAGVYGVDYWWSGPDSISTVW